MKTIPIALANHLRQETTSVCVCIRVERSDGVVLGFTSLDRTVTVAGIDYEPSFDLSAIGSSEGLDVDNLELSVLPDDDKVTNADLQSGLWNGADFTVFQVNFNAPNDGIDTLKRGTAGEVKYADGRFAIEFRGLKQALQQPQGIQTQKTCRARFGDEKCKVGLSEFTFEYVVAEVESRRRFTDDSTEGTDDPFSNGVLTFNSGLNSGYERRVQTYEDGTYTVDLAFPFDIEVGDEFTVVVGCRKRLIEDCKNRFDNILNFQGEPHLPGIDKISGKKSATDDEEDEE